MALPRPGDKKRKDRKAPGKKGLPSRKEAEARARAEAEARRRGDAPPRAATHKAAPAARSAATEQRQKRTPPRSTPGKKTPRGKKRKKGPGMLRRTGRRLAADARAMWGTDADPTWFRTIFEPVPRHPRPVAKPFAVTILSLNIAPFPGLGTVLYGKWERGLAQFLLTFVFLIGWVWAVSDGIIAVRTAWKADAKPPRGPRKAPPPGPAKSPTGQQPGPRKKAARRPPPRRRPPKTG